MIQSSDNLRVKFIDSDGSLTDLKYCVLINHIDKPSTKIHSSDKIMFNFLLTFCLGVLNNIA